MSDSIKHINLRINKAELDVINEIIESRSDLFVVKNISENAYLLTFNSNEKIIELDELIKDKLIYKGFDMNYNPNKFGRICENLIDKLYQMLR